MRVLDFIQGIVFGGGVFIGAIALVAVAVWLAVVIVCKTDETIEKLRKL